MRYAIRTILIVPAAIVGYIGLLLVVPFFWLGDDTDDAHKPDDCPPVMPPRAKVPHVDLYA